jgi:hypothetical protein
LFPKLRAHQSSARTVSGVNKIPGLPRAILESRIGNLSVVERENEAGGNEGRTLTDRG